MTNAHYLQRAHAPTPFQALFTGNYSVAKSFGSARCYSMLAHTQPSDEITNTCHLSLATKKTYIAQTSKNLHSSTYPLSLPVSNPSVVFPQLLSACLKHQFFALLSTCYLADHALPLLFVVVQSLKRVFHRQRRSLIKSPAPLRALLTIRHTRLRRTISPAPEQRSSSHFLFTGRMELKKMQLPSSFSLGTKRPSTDVKNMLFQFHLQTNNFSY